MTTTATNAESSTNCTAECYAGNPPASGRGPRAGANMDGAMHVNVFGDRKARLSPGWAKETVVTIFGDSTLDASAEPGPNASLTVFGLFSEATVRVPPGARVSEGGVSLFGDRTVDIGGGEGGEIRINAYGAFCDLKVVEVA